MALHNNYEVSVLCCTFNNWSKNNNEEIKQRLQPRINYYEVSGNRSPFLPWLFSSIYFFLSKFLLLFFPKNIFFLSLKSNKRSFLLLQEIKKIKEHIDLVVAHNPGSFYPAFKFAQQRQIPFGIDLEDYHPGEANDKRQAEYSRSLLQQVLPKAAYISAASPLILEESQRVTSQFSGNVEVVLNYFGANEFTSPLEKDADPIKLVWFSQNIAEGRGLEEIIPAISNTDNIELHLYGNLNPVFYKKYIEGVQNIYLHGALPQADLHKALSLYDVGLAIEPGKDLNNELAISNKLLAYFQAGLYIVASDTSAQKQFIQEYPEHGVLTTLKKTCFEHTLIDLWNNKTFIRSQMVGRFLNAKKNSWETESQKLVQIWEGILK